MYDKKYDNHIQILCFGRPCYSGDLEKIFFGNIINGRSRVKDRLREMQEEKLMIEYHVKDINKRHKRLNLISIENNDEDKKVYFDENEIVTKSAYQRKYFILSSEQITNFLLSGFESINLVLPESLKNQLDKLIDSDEFREYVTFVYNNIKKNYSEFPKDNNFSIKFIAMVFTLLNRSISQQIEVNNRKKRTMRFDFTQSKKKINEKYLKNLELQQDISKNNLNIEDIILTSKCIHNFIRYPNLLRVMNKHPILEDMKNLDYVLLAKDYISTSCSIVAC